jgi:hypothetical protein
VMRNVKLVVGSGRGIDETIQRERKGKDTIKTRKKSTCKRASTPPSHSPCTIARSLNNHNLSPITPRLLEPPHLCLPSPSATLY